MKLRPGLQFKAVVGLFIIAVLPLAASFFMVRRVAEVAQNVVLGETERLHRSLDRAVLAYRAAVDARKEAFQHAGEAAAERLARACGGDAPRAVQAEVDRDPALWRAELDDAVAVRGDPGDRLQRVVDLSAGACRARLTYATDTGAELAADYQALGETLATHRTFERIRQSMPPYYQTAFILVVGGFALATTLVATVVAGRLTRRLGRLAEATRRVAEGDLDTRVRLSGKDELADLARAFDAMVVDLGRSRAQIEYLQKIAAWQEVARRLAHEIKNPLTPIQLAVQDLSSRYDGADPAFRSKLDDATEIVTEEIAGLRRLVDAFSVFAKLPRVEPKPLDLAAVVDDLARDLPLEARPPPAPVTVSGDRMLLRRALANLADNALQAGARKVRVSWRRDGTLARLRIEDDGPGVAPELAERIFDPYVTTKPHGSGLGLAIAKKTILEHGGTIALAAASALGGAAFDITLPLAG
ncbi:MAG TPA: ATP-binding protein [Haliangiales bacterium]|nr:ATP-binding protein [Haliangiales bacterium]